MSDEKEESYPGGYGSIKELKMRNQNKTKTSSFGKFCTEKDILDLYGSGVALKPKKHFVLADATDKKVKKIMNSTYQIYGFTKQVLSQKNIKTIKTNTHQ